MLALRASKEWRGRLGAFCRASAIAIPLCLLNACSLTSGETQDRTWLRDGSLGLSRPVPAASRSADSASARASLRTDHTSAPDGGGSNFIVISRKDKTLTAVSPGSSPLVFKSEGAQNLPEGTFSVTLKEENPLWYAPPDYFQKRSLPIPEEGSRERFKRAALGSKTIFLSNHTPIHSGPVWMEEIGGVRLGAAEMQQLFSMITVGTRVEIR